MILSLQGYVLPKIPVVRPGTVDWCLMFMYSANSVFFPRPQRKNTCRSNLDWIIKHATFSNLHTTQRCALIILC